MKNTFHKITGAVLILCALTAVSCDLEIENYSQLGPDNALNTESDLKAAVTGLYYEFRSGGWAAYNCGWGSLMTMQVGCTDEADCNFLWEDQTDFQWDPSTSMGEMYTFYNYFTPAITRATALLERMKPVAVSAPVKRSCNAQIRTLRAMWAYDLYDLFGPLPIITDPEVALNPMQTYQPSRPTADAYVRFVESELHAVQENLKQQDELSSAEWGQMTVGIAQAYLLRLFMHEAGQEAHWRTGTSNANKWWTKVDSLTQVMTGAGTPYALMNDYMSIWKPENKGNKEIIFAIPCSPIGGWGNIFLAEALPADYKSQDGVALTCWGGFLTPWAVYDSFATGDKRRDGLKAEYWNGIKMVNRRTDAISGKPGAFPMKYPENPNTTGNWDGSDYVHIRYAEVLLSRAEALNELGATPSQACKDLVHQVRRRAFANYDGSANYNLIQNITTKEAMRAQILNENLWEFYWEGKRRPDLIRNGSLITNAQARGKVMAEEKHILYCIPQSARYENPNLRQNDGWD